MMFLFIMTFLLGCHDSTSIVGKWVYNGGDFEYTYIFNKDGTYEDIRLNDHEDEPLAIKTYQNGQYTVTNLFNEIDIIEMTINEYWGKIPGEETMDLSIYHQNAETFRYKNYFGIFYECVVPDGETFDLLLYTGIDDDGYEYYRIQFYLDGTYSIYWISEKYAPPKDFDYEMEYSRKGNKISFKDNDKSWYFIVDDGLFLPYHYIKK